LAISLPPFFANVFISFSAYADRNVITGHRSAFISFSSRAKYTHIFLHLYLSLLNKVNIQMAEAVKKAGEAVKDKASGN
jgi:hypothetical protein